MDEVEALRSSLPPSIDFSRFVHSLQPHFISVRLPSDDRMAEEEEAEPKDPEVVKKEYRKRIERLKREQVGRFA